MSNIINEFPRLQSVQVVVEERKVALQLSPNTWRTHAFSGLEAIPEKLKPAFADASDEDELELLEIVRRSYQSGRVETRFEAPYRSSGSSKGPTVLRTVMVRIDFRKEARPHIKSSTGDFSKSPLQQ